MLKKSLLIILIIAFSGLPQAFAQSAETAAANFEKLDLEKFYFENIQPEAPADSLSANLTPEVQSRLGILPGELRTFVQTKTITIKDVTYPTTTEYIQGDLTLNQLIEVLSVMQNDLLKMLLENPKLKFKIKFLEEGRQVSKNLPIKFFINLLRSSDRIDYKKIELDPILKKAIETDKKFRTYVNSQFDKAKLLIDDGSEYGKEEVNYSPKVILSTKSKISFAIMRFSGILAIPFSATYLVPPTLGILLTTIPDMNVFLITQLFVASSSLGLQMVMNQLANWMSHGWPNFDGYKFGNSKLLEYKRWWILEGAFLAIIPLIHASLGVYPEVPIMDYAFKAMFHTALISTATQGLWDLYFIDKRNKQLLVARAKDAALRQTRIDMLGSSASNMTNTKLEEALHPEETKVMKTFNRNMVLNSIVSVSLGSIQMTAMAAGLDGVVLATFCGYGAYGITALYKVIKERASTPKTVDEKSYLEILRMVRLSSPNLSWIGKFQQDSYIAAVRIFEGVKTAKKSLYEFFENKNKTILEKNRNAAKLEAERTEKLSRPSLPAIQILSCQTLFG